jgi:hypothetical protein
MEGRSRVSLPTVNIAYLGAGFKLVKERILEHPVYSLRRLVDNRWITINYWDDIGHVASLLVIFGYEADMQSALDMLNILNGA